MTFVKATDTINVDGNGEIRTQTKRTGSVANIPALPENRLGPSESRHEVFDRELLFADALMATLRTEGLTKSYGGRIGRARGSLDVASGEVVGLLGPNGAGKTTTFYMTVGLTAPDRAA